MPESLHDCYGYEIECVAHPDAAAIPLRLFGPASPESAPDGSVRQRIHLNIDIDDGTGPLRTPPYFPPGWPDADPLIIETGSSRGTVSPSAWSIDIILSYRDLENPVVWGRMLAEKALLILTLRSQRHYGLHAGAVVVNGRSAIVTADSGVGKSTFTAWALRRGGHFVGEDALMRHLDQESGAFWGFPRIAYLDPDLIREWPELATAQTTPVPGRDKVRLEWPATFADRLTPATVPSALLVLTRAHRELREISTDDAVDRCRSDFAEGKAGTAAEAEVAADVRARFDQMLRLEFGLGPDLDANFDQLCAVLAR